MPRWTTCASLTGLLAAAVFALSCGDGVAPERHGFGVPDFALSEDVLTASFDAGADAFGYRDDPFRGTAAPAYASGTFSATGGFSGGGLRVLLGGIADDGVLGMSGGWAATFTLSAPEDVTLTLRYQLTQSSEYESDEYSDALVSVDGILRGIAGTDRLARLTGDGNGGISQTTSWQQVELAIPGLSAGPHTVVLGAYNNKKTAANETTELLIDDVAITVDTGVSVEQTPGTGDLTIATATTGEGQPAGYTMSVTAPDGTPFTLTFAATESKTFTEQAAGDYRLEITDIPTNCGLTGGTNPRTVGVPDGGSASTTFQINCTATTGNLKVKTSTTGSNLPAGYTLSISGPGGSTSQAIGATDSVTFSAIPAGDYTATLSNVPANCTVSGANPRTVTVAAGATASTTFSVSCTTTTGNLKVKTSTTGSSLDPDGYTVTVNGSNARAIAINDSITYTGVPAGTYTVALSGVASNCSVSGGTSRTATVTAGATATVSYSVSCTTPPGDLKVSTSSSGSSIPTSYTVKVDGSLSKTIASTGSVTFTGLAAGSHSVVLTVPSNCTVSGGATRTVSVPSGGTGSVSYSVSCVTPNTAPSVNAGSDQNVLLGLLYTLSASFSDPDNGPWSYTINWGDGSSSSGSKSSTGTISASHNYILIGSYTIRVTVTDSRGASGSDTKVLTVLTNLGGIL